MRAGLVGILLLVVLTGCGGDDEAGPVVADPSERCDELISPVLAAVQELDSRLRSGMNREQFDERAGDVQVALDSVSQDAANEVAMNCGAAYAALATVPDLNQLIKVEWNACDVSEKFLAIGEPRRCKSSDLDESTGEVTAALGRARAALEDLGS